MRAGRGRRARPGGREPAIINERAVSCARRQGRAHPGRSPNPSRLRESAWRGPGLSPRHPASRSKPVPPKGGGPKPFTAQGTMVAGAKSHAWAAPPGIFRIVAQPGGLGRGFLGATADEAAAQWLWVEGAAVRLSLWFGRVVRYTPHGEIASFRAPARTRQSTSARRPWCRAPTSGGFCARDAA